MSRYIDADALKEHIEVITYEGMWHTSETDEFVSVENIENAPSIDIVRCKECYMCDEEMWCSFFDSIMESDDYCSYGEREGE